MSKRIPKLEPCLRCVIQASANILGPSSASAKALAEFDRRIASGENVVLFVADGSVIIGPPNLPEILAESRP